jgi:hypothetical protein
LLPAVVAKKKFYFCYGKMTKQWVTQKGGGVGGIGTWDKYCCGLEKGFQMVFPFCSMWLPF